jgi:hypothetical protein
MIMLAYMTAPLNQFKVPPVMPVLNKEIDQNVEFHEATL